MSRYLKFLAAQQQAKSEADRAAASKGASEARIRSWKNWAQVRRDRRRNAARERDRDLALRMAAFLAGMTPEQRDEALLIEDLRAHFPGHNRPNIGAALRTAGWVSVQRAARDSPCGKRWVWVRQGGPLAPRW